MNEMEKLVTLLNGSRKNEFTVESLTSFLDVLGLKLVSSDMVVSFRAMNSDEIIANKVGLLVRRLSVLNTYDFTYRANIEDAIDYVNRGDYKAAQDAITSAGIGINKWIPEEFNKAYYDANELVASLVVISRNKK